MLVLWFRLCQDQKGRMRFTKWKCFYDYRDYTNTNEHAHAALWHTNYQIFKFPHTVTCKAGVGDMTKFLYHVNGINQTIVIFAGNSSKYVLRWFMTDERTSTETASHYIKIKLKQSHHFEGFWDFVDSFWKIKSHHRYRGISVADSQQKQNRYQWRAYTVIPPSLI